MPTISLKIFFVSSDLAGARSQKPEEKTGRQLTDEKKALPTRGLPQKPAERGGVLRCTDIVLTLYRNFTTLFIHCPYKARQKTNSPLWAVCFLSEV